MGRHQFFDSPLACFAETQCAKRSCGQTSPCGGRAPLRIVWEDPQFDDDWPTVVVWHQPEGRRPFLIVTHRDLDEHREAGGEISIMPFAAIGGCVHL